MIAEQLKPLLPASLFGLPAWAECRPLEPSPHSGRVALSCSGCFSCPTPARPLPAVWPRLLSRGFGFCFRASLLGPALPSTASLGPQLLTTTSPRPMLCGVENQHSLLPCPVSMDP